MDKNKKLIILVSSLLCICIIGLIVYFVTRPRVDDGGDVVTVSEGKIYKDTTDATQQVFISSLSHSDATNSGDNVKVTEKNNGFKFKCHGLKKNINLYVFVDGNIDNIAGSYTINESMFSSKLTLKDSFMKEGKHVVQFVQFDGPDVVFCKTKHFIVEK